MIAIIAKYLKQVDDEHKVIFTKFAAEMLEYRVHEKERLLKTLNPRKNEKA